MIDILLGLTFAFGGVFLLGVGAWLFDRIFAIAEYIVDEIERSKRRRERK